MLLAACGGGNGSKTKPADPLSLLREAKATIDATSGLHFVLTGSQVPSGASGVTAGEGDAVRPDAFQGSLTVSGAGLSGTVKVISVGHVVYAKLPLIPGYHTINPANYGFGDPGRFIDPTAGLSGLLVTPTSAAYDGQTRVGGVVLDRVKAQLPGAPVAQLLGSADSKAPVDADIGIDPASHQIRSVVLTGPFFSAGQRSTFTLTLSRYGESVEVRAPS
ncbi:MAG: lipoprotein LprG [Frankiales bacterium]|nr:lipoprotein LprG [Frankiales bacterium]